MRAKGDGEEWLMLCDLSGNHSSSLDDTPFTAPSAGGRWSLQISSEEQRFGGADANSFDPLSGKFTFREPGMLLFRVLS